MVLAAILVLAGPVAAKTIYVHPVNGIDSDGAHWGSSWTFPYRTLEFAMAEARAAAGTDKIRLARGTYSLTGDAVLLDDGVTITGRKNGRSVITGGSGFSGSSLLQALDLTKQVTLNSLTFVGGGSNAALDIQLGSSVLVNDSVFRDNDGYFAGAILVGQGSLWVERTLFEDNESLTAGGAIRILGGQYPSSAHINRSTFLGNESSNAGGAIAALGDVSLSVTNSVFCGNRGTYGGAIYGQRYYEDPEIRVTNSSIGGNVGGGIARETTSVDLSVSNTIVWGNDDDDIDDAGSDTNFTLGYSFVGNLDDLSVVGPRNSDSNPLWEDLDACDLHLTAWSMPIDRGDNSALGAHFDSTDIDGDPRIQGPWYQVDVGADEY